MSKYDEKYDAAGAESPSSHVRGIIQQLNDEKPSKEKSREVVIRPDGSKVVRVTKKRRVMVSEAEKRKAGRRSFMMILLGFFVLSFAAVGVLLFRMSQMSGEAYVQSRVDELKAAWGAASVELVGVGVEGTSFHLTGIVAEFPKDSVIQHVELSDISGDLDTSTFFTNVISSDKLSVKRAVVEINPELNTLQMPLFQGEELWKLRSIDCESIQVKMGDKVALKDAHAYLYHPRSSDKSVCTLVLSGGTLAIRGMQQIRLRDSKLLLSPRGIEEFSVNGTTDRANQEAGKLSTSLSVTGRVAVGEPLAGPFEFDTDNMPLSAFTYGHLGDVLSGRTVLQSVGSEHSRARILLPLETDAPEYSGEFTLKEISLSGFPVQEEILRHMEDEKRSDFRPAIIHQGRVRLQASRKAVQVEFPEDWMEELDGMSLVGTLAVNDDNEISGTLNIGIPAILTHTEYIDGKPDPLFRENAGGAWVTVDLSGTVNVPGDNSAMLIAQTQEARQARPGRLNLDEVNFSKISKQINKDLDALHEADSDYHPSPAPDATSPSADEPSDETLFQTPSGGRLDMSSPLDDNLKGIFD